jgi:hypothetical protein
MAKFDLMTAAVVAALILGMLAITGVKIGAIEPPYYPTEKSITKDFHKICGLYRASEATGTDMLGLAGYTVQPGQPISFLKECAVGWGDGSGIGFGAVYDPGSPEVKELCWVFEAVSPTCYPVTTHIAKACEELFVDTYTQDECNFVLPPPPI